MELIAAVPTPFAESGELDLDAAARIFGFVAAAPASLLVAGTTGEFPSLDDDERIALFKLALDAAGPERTVLHIGAADTRRATRLAAAAVSHGATRLAAITPYYLPARLDELAAHFAAVRQAAGDAVVYAYIFTERTGISLSPTELRRVAEHAGIAGVKLSGSSAARVAEYIQRAPAGFAVYSGDDGHVPEAAGAGAAGIVSGMSSALPELFATLAADPGKPLARSAAAEAAALIGPSIGRLKYALSARGLAGTASRMTVDPPDAATRAAIDELMAPWIR